jgi:hypothetical protein
LTRHGDDKEDETINFGNERKRERGAKRQKMVKKVKKKKKRKIDNCGDAEDTSEIFKMVMIITGYSTRLRPIGCEW